MSYFVGAEAMDNDEFKGEDAGFAINGGKGWSKVVFRNHQIKCYGEVALAMGDYVFTDATSGDEVRVEYSFGYQRNDDGNVRICLHHSSVPYSAAPAPVTEAEVLEAQALWANQIAAISKVYADKGDYVAAAGEAAGQLYGYGKCDVLFKPTKSTKNPFRPTGESAMSCAAARTRHTRRGSTLQRRSAAPHRPQPPPHSRTLSARGSTTAPL